VITTAAIAMFTALLGWASVRGELPPQAWILFAILFFWQFPHFLAIDTMYAKDFGRAGIRLLPPVDGKGGTATASSRGSLPRFPPRSRSARRSRHQ
jgi:heme O synthase-like polyprenyltransferase